MIGLLFFFERLLKELGGVIVAESLGERAQRSVGGDLIVFDSLCGRNESGVENIGDKFYREHLDPRSGFPNPQMFRPGINVYLGAEVRY